MADWKLPAAFSAPDGAFNGALNREGYAYFFSSDQHLRYSWDNEAPDAGYPKPLNNLRSIPTSR